MPTISPYTPSLVLPEYKTTSYDTQLEFAILGKRQQEYTQVLSRLNNLKSTSLNISMINEKGKQKLDQYNQELNNMLGSDLGDLSDSKVQAKVSSYFTKVATDDDLKRRSQLSRYYQDQLSTIDQMQNSKDPTKSGYNSINDFVFRNWNGGLNDFVKADAINGWEQKQQRYVPYKDIDQKLVNLTKLIHADSQSTQGPVNDSPGYSMLEADKGVSKDKIRTMLQSTLDQDELSQMEVMSKYRILQQGPEGKMTLFNSYNGWINDQKEEIKKQLDQATSFKNQFDPSKVDSKLPDADKKAKQQEYKTLQDYYTKQEQELKGHYLKAEQNNLTIDEWSKFDNNDMLPYINQMMVEDRVNGISEALSWKESVKKAGIDETYFAGRKLSLMEQRLQLDAELGKAKLQIEGLKASKDAKDAAGQSYSQPADIFKSNESVISSWEDFTNTEKQFANKITPIISSEDFRPEQLKNSTWLSQNADNYQVKLWNAYKARVGDESMIDGKPNINGFKAFEAQALNGDYKSDPYINEVVSDLSRDKDISQYYTGVAKEVATSVNKELNPDEIKLPGGQYSLGDYARKNGWDGKGEMTFGLPTENGGYKQYTYTELKNEYNKRKPDWKENAFLTAAGVVVNPLYGQDVKSSFKDQIFGEDPNLFRLIGMAQEQEQRKQTVIQDAIMTKLPQQFQGKQLVALDDKTRTNAIGSINQAVKLASDSAPISIDASEVTNVSIPYGLGSYGGFSISEKEAKRLSEAGAKIVTVGGELQNPQPNVWYKVPMPAQNSYDVVYNDIFEKKGSVSKVIDGNQVRIGSIANSPYVTLTINGDTRTVPKKDVNQIFGEVEYALKQTQTSTPK